MSASFQNPDPVDIDGNFHTRRPLILTGIHMKRTGQILLTSIVTVLLSGVLPAGAENLPAESTALTEAEKAAGWVPLFDGKSLNGWRNYRGDDTIAAGWVARDGVLIKQRGVNGGNIITQKKYRDFELSFEWSVEPKGNNGIKYLVIEERPGAPGHEYQLLDDAGHPDGKIGPKRQTASLYDILPPAADKQLNRPGAWNHATIIIRGLKVQHWLNGKQVLEYTLQSPELKAAIAESKFKNAKGFGDKVDGYIMITDHGDECQFRNLKIREF